MLPFGLWKLSHDRFDSITQPLKWRNVTKLRRFNPGRSCSPTIGSALPDREKYP